MTLDILHDLSGQAGDLSAATKTEIERAYVDTLACLCAGWNEPVTAAVRRVHANVGAPWEQGVDAEPETAALVWGTAAHALDYDDVHMTSVTHPSAVLFPAIEAIARHAPAVASRRAGAYAVGLAFNVAIGKALGFRHYEHGWHATSTIGAVSAGAACAYLLDLEGDAFVSALAIAAAQAGGLQRNFGTMAKPLQAGLAAQVGVRAGRLAAAGLGGAQDVFSGPGGFLAVFGGDPDAGLIIDVEEAVRGLSRKLFACCYMAHRPVAAAIRLHRSGEAAGLDADSRIEVDVPPGCLTALTVAIPSTGMEAKFSGQYTVAYTLLRGTLGLQAFTDESFGAPDVMDLAGRVALRETAAPAPGEVGMDRGAVTLRILRPGRDVVSETVADYPGSPAAPITDSELAAKLADCVAIGAPGEPNIAGWIGSQAAGFAGRS